jgi:hypothetical protein
LFDLQLSSEKLRQPDADMVIRGEAGRGWTAPLDQHVAVFVAEKSKLNLVWFDLG